MLTTPTIAGLHDFVLKGAVARHVRNGMRAIDLGAGTGAFAVRLRELGCEVVAVDMDKHAFQANIAFHEIDLDSVDFPSQIGAGGFDLVTAVEVIEHVENPIGFLRNVARMLKPGGIAVITTPNVDNSAARLKFFLTGKLRAMDEAGDPTHISPIFWDLFVRQYLRRVQLQLVEHRVYPSHGFQVTRPRYAWLFRLLAQFLRGECLLGDSHVFVLQSPAP